MKRLLGTRLARMAQAVEALVTGVGRVQERLKEAAICLVSVHPDAILHKDLQRIFVGVKYGSKFRAAAGRRGTDHRFAPIGDGIGSFAGYVTCDKLPK
jgi:hypothetical protein